MQPVAVLVAGRWSRWWPAPSLGLSAVTPGVPLLPRGRGPDGHWPSPPERVLSRLLQECFAFRIVGNAQFTKQETVIVHFLLIILLEYLLCARHHEGICMLHPRNWHTVAGSVVQEAPRARLEVFTTDSCPTPQHLKDSLFTKGRFYCFSLGDHYLVSAFSFFTYCGVSYGHRNRN